jgi:hypothetical protein
MALTARTVSGLRYVPPGIPLGRLNAKRAAREVHSEKRDGSESRSDVSEWGADADGPLGGTVDSSSGIELSCCFVVDVADEVCSCTLRRSDEIRTC